MNYEFRNWQQNGSVIKNGDGTSTLPIMVTTGIVGDTYGFIRNDATSVTFKNSLSVDDSELAVQNGAIAFVAKTYPNT